MQRFKNYVLWAAIAGLLGMALLDLGAITGLERYEQYVDKVLYVLILLGIINNPSSGKGLKDEQKL